MLLQIGVIIILETRSINPDFKYRNIAYNREIKNLVNFQDLRYLFPYITINIKLIPY